MFIPNLTQLWENGKLVLNKEFVDFNDVVNWSPKRSIEVLWNIAYEILYAQDVQSWKITQEYAENKLQAINHSYASVKHKFQNIERNNWWRYFDHLLRVAYNILTQSKTPSLRKFLIALNHDSIEDTDYDLHTLETTLNVKIALGVWIISKRPFTELARESKNKWLVWENFQEILDEMHKYWILREDSLCLSASYLDKKYNNRHLLTVHDQQLEKVWLESLSDSEKYKFIESSWILNRKWLLNDRYINKKNFGSHKITLEERFFEELYETLNVKYKNVRNQEFFSHMVPYFDWFYSISEFKESPCIINFYNHALNIIEKNKIIIETDIIKYIVLDALEVKFWDRIDNLATTEVYNKFTTENVKKAYRKIEETKSYFYKIAQEYDIIQWTNFYNLIEEKIEKLEEYIFEYQCISIWSDIRSKVSKTLL